MDEKKLIIEETEHEEYEHHHDHDHDHEHEYEHDHEHVHEPHDHEEHEHHDHEHEHRFESRHKHPKEFIPEEHEHHHHEHDEHDHDHDHDHEDHDHHDHDHGTQYEVPGYDLVETHDHEGATVCSFERKTSMPSDEVKAAFEESMREMEEWLNAQGAIIGHVKGYVREMGSTVTFSTVGAELNMTEIEGSGAELGFASIVFGPTQEELKDKVIEVFRRIH